MAALPVHPRPWRSRLTLCFGLITTAVLAVGAKNVTTELYQRPKLRLQAAFDQQSWCQAVLAGVPDSHNERWQELACRYPEQVIRACADEACEVQVADE